MILGQSNSVAKGGGSQALLYNWVRMNMIFKSSRSQMFYKIVILKNFAEFSWKRLRAQTVLKRDSSAGVFLRILRNFQEVLFHRAPLNDCFWIFSYFLLFIATQWINRNHVFYYFWTCFIKAFENDECHEFCNWITIETVLEQYPPRKIAPQHFN